MTRHAFFIADDRIIHVANASGAGFQYRAQAMDLSPDCQIEAQCHEFAETVLVVRSGRLEIMVNGATGIVNAGSFVRIPPQTVYAYRDAGTGMARILYRTAPAVRERGSCCVSIRIAAA